MPITDWAFYGWTTIATDALTFTWPTTLPRASFTITTARVDSQRLEPRPEWLTVPTAANRPVWESIPKITTTTVGPTSSRPTFQTTPTIFITTTIPANSLIWPVSRTLGPSASRSSPLERSFSTSTM